MNEPRVSIIIPTYNRANFLRNNLSALARQDINPEIFEVIVVDDGSSQDPNPEIDQEWPFELFLYRQEHQGATEAKNFGATHARGNVIFFIDDDIEVTSNYVSTLLKVHEDYDRAIVLGHLFDISTNTNSVFGRIVNSRNQQKTATKEIEIVKFDQCLGGLFSIKRNHFFELGQWRGIEDSWPNWEDIIIAYHALQCNFMFLRCADALGYHHDPNLQDLHTLCQRWERAARAAALLFHRYPDLQTQIPMFRDILPISVEHDPWRLTVRKILRSFASIKSITSLMQATVTFLERVYPNPTLLEALYKWITGGFIFRGYRQGLRFLI